MHRLKLKNSTPDNKAAYFFQTQDIKKSQDIYKIFNNAST